MGRQFQKEVDIMSLDQLREAYERAEKLSQKSRHPRKTAFNPLSNSVPWEELGIHH